MLVIHYNIHCINNFLPYCNAYASSEESGKLHVYSKYTWSMIRFQHLKSKQGLSGLIQWYDRLRPSRKKHVLRVSN